MLRVNEIFYTIQGEGYHAGTAAVFVRLEGCNLACSFCDTAFNSGEPRSESWMLKEIRERGGDCKFVVLTGGEPSMQDVEAFVSLVKENGYYVSIETNGMFELPRNIDWVCCSPKIGTQSKRLLIKEADEFKFVVGYDGRLPNIRGLASDLFWISPMNGAAISKDGGVEVGDRGCSKVKRLAAQYCASLVQKDNRFRLNVQMHKYIGVE